MIITALGLLFFRTMTGLSSPTLFRVLLAPPWLRNVTGTILSSATVLPMMAPSKIVYE